MFGWGLIVFYYPLIALMTLIVVWDILRMGAFSFHIMDMVKILSDTYIELRMYTDSRSLNWKYAMMQMLSMSQHQTFHCTTHMRGNYMQLLIFDLKPIMMDEFGLLHSQQKTPGTCDLYIYIYHLVI